MTTHKLYGIEVAAPEPGLYLHVKTKQLYQVIGVFQHTEKDTWFVAYVHLDNETWVADHNRKYVRPLLGPHGFLIPGRFVRKRIGPPKPGPDLHYAITEGGLSYRRTI